MPSILVSGPVKGNFTSLFNAVAKAQKKGEFAAALCVGNFLGETRDAPAEAAPLLRRALEGREAALGPTHPHTLMSVNNLGALLKAMGKHGEALPLSQRALALGLEHICRTRRSGSARTGGAPIPY